MTEIKACRNAIHYNYFSWIQQIIVAQNIRETRIRGNILYIYICRIDSTIVVNEVHVCANQCDILMNTRNYFTNKLKLISQHEFLKLASDWPALIHQPIRSHIRRFLLLSIVFFQWRGAFGDAAQNGTSKVTFRMWNFEQGSYLHT